MDLEPGKTSRSVSLGLAIVGQAALAAGLTAMLVITTRGASELTDPAARRLLLRLALLSLVLLLGLLLMVVWSIIRYIRHRLHLTKPLEPSTYVNAWELAGKRFKLEDNDAEEQDRDPWDPDGNDAGGGP
ncbi:MAG TPA: hypothetical protein VM031_06390 [Phycisphaerae bacterium]|nr:hypothetical protein [Phycisphaerae bacterium]